MPAPHLDVIGAQDGGAREALGGLRGAVGGQQCIGNIEVRIHAAGIDVEQGAVDGERLLGATQAVEDRAFVQQRRLGAGLDLQGRVDFPQRLVEAPLLQGDDRQAMQGDEVARLASEDLAIGLLGSVSRPCWCSSVACPSASSVAVGSPDGIFALDGSQANARAGSSPIR